jgi:hypothetical protein
MAIAAGARAQATDRILAEIAAAAAIANATHRLFQRTGQFQATLALAFQKMKRHPLRTLAAYARQATKRFDEIGKKW